ncbi:MAG: hypothetical protein ABSC56_09730 [Solirubrobacteraceae bacterium]|jgi:hypothetical protein
MRLNPRRIRPAELLALGSGLLLAVSLFLPWYEFPSGQHDAFNSLTVAEIPAIGAAVLALALVLATVFQRSPALPVALAVWTTAVGFLAVVVLVVRTLTLPGMATERCYGLWLALAGAVGVLVAAWLSMRDESPFWGVPANGTAAR